MITNQDIELMDKVFAFEYKNKNSDILAELNISDKTYQYTLSQICDYNDNIQQLLVYEKTNGGTIFIVRFLDIIPQKFIDNGGFNTYFKNQKNQQDLKERKEITEIENLEWNYKTRWISIISMILSVIAIIISIIK